MQKILENLEIIDNWAKNSPAPETLKNNDEFMEVIVKIMNYTLYLLKVSVALASDSKSAHNGVSKNTAIVVGHLVRVTKLYEGLLVHITRNELELAAIFFRLMYESALRMNYLMRSKTKSKTFHSFVLVSYRPEKDILKDLHEKEAARPLINIEKRIVRKIQNRLRQDGIEEQELMNNRVWDVDGKNMKAMLETMGLEKQYAYVFANGSHFVHGDWYDIDLHHIYKKGRFYLPKLSYDVPDPRLACSATTLCLGILPDYLKWRKSDTNNVVTPTINKLFELNQKIDMAHENTLTA